MNGPVGSVVIPAHDEADRIGATLDSLMADVEADEFEVVVVCNGCTDDTADVARRRDGVQVEELAASSKIAALRHGETVATVFPRIYLDGDVELSTAAARQLVAALDVDEPRAAGVVGRLDTTDATVPTRWYFDFRQRLPVFAQGIIGAGVYAMNEAGRKRFDTWPDILGDDQFVFRLFDEHERITVSGHHTRVEAPGDLATVVRRQVRVRRGNAQLTTGGGDRAPLAPPPAGIADALRDVRTRPSAWLGVATWVAVNATVRLLSRLPTRGDWT